MRPARRLKPLAATLGLAVCLVPLLGDEIPCEWTGVERVVAVGDLHGDYDNFVRILRGTRLVDAKLAWTGGKAHLVQTGDILDRGPRAKEILDLLRRLEREAAKDGGMVHVLLGNHEELNITGIVFSYPDYVTLEQFVAFLPRAFRRDTERKLLRGLGSPLDGRPGEPADAGIRAKLKERWLEVMGSDAGRRSYLKGFLDPYGRWLLGKNAAIRINDVVYVHGGISPKYSTWKLQEINDLLRRELEFFMGREKALIKLPREFEPKIVYDANGPLWYRDLATREEGEMEADLGRTLKRLGARAMVIAHTFYRGSGLSPVISPSYMSRFDGRLWIIDTGISDFYGGVISALLVENGSFALWGEAAEGTETVSGGAPTRAPAPERADIEEFLSLAPVATIVRAGQLGRTEPWTVVLTDGLDVRRAFFKYVDRRRPGVLADSYRYEIAAYIVSRALGLDVVPPVVEREVDGVRGSLQVLLEGAVSESARRARAMEPPDPEGFERAMATVKAFAILVADDCENPRDTLIDPTSWSVHRVDFSEAFGPSPEVPQDCLPPGVPAGFLERLRGWDEAKLAERLSPYLIADEIEALFLRKTILIKLLEGRCR